ncbi:diguanylate cyclase [Lysobacter korlensis]|uniref:diguanylate cyclase n=1 Tax=Lysobacter korlensis TaxID=553636 RepID=A0ABV6S0F1_9GAMM
MRKLPALLIGLALACMPAASIALDPEDALHQHVRGSWSIQEGLPQISAIAITQDRDGYVWVGTQAGLARFDGVRFTAYTPESTPGLAGMFVRSLHTGRDGRIWIGTYKGVTVRDRSGFTHVPVADPTRFPSIDVAAIAEGASGTIWVAASEGLFRVEDGRLHHVEGSPSPAASLLPQRSGLLVGGRSAVHYRTASGWQRSALPTEAENAAVNRLVRTQGRLWAATAFGLYHYDAATGWQAFEAPQLRATPLELLYPDSDGNLWVGGDTGMARIRDGRLAEFVPADGPGGIQGARVAYEDREGSLWVGSQWEGLTRLWDSWVQRFSVAEGLDERIVWSVSPDPDGRRIWTGTNDGLSVLEGGRYRTVVPGTRLPHPQGYNLLAEDDRIWVGTRRGLVIVRPQPDGSARVEQPAFLAPLAGLQINGIVREGDAYWIPTSDGLFALRGERLQRYGKDEGLTDARVRYLHLADDGRLLVGTQSGLYERRGERFVEIGEDRGLPPNLDVTSIVTLDGGQMVLGTLGERIHFFDGRRWIEFDEPHGMPRNSPFFLAHHDGYIWATGIRGITRAPLADLRAFAAGRIKRVRGEMLLNERGDPMSGQQGYCCNGAGTSKGFLRDGTLWLPSRDGVVAMDTDAIVKNRTVPHAVVERVQVEDRWQPAVAIAGETLPAGARDLSFEFTVLSFQDPKSVGIEYRLVGYDREWRQADPFNRSARYTNLPPGDYAFEVRGANNAGVATAKAARLAFSVQPRFHETALFYALSVLLLATLVYAGYRLQQHRYRARQRELENLVQQRTEALEIANHRLEEASQTDPLTALRNRRYMANQIPADLAYYDRQRQQATRPDDAMVFALVDIDFFKAVNDNHGHRAGDRVLQQFAQVLGRLVRSGDYVVRWGGEEFLVVFRPMPTRNLTMIGDRIRAAVAEHEFDVGTGTPLRLTCSTGLAEYPLFRDHRTQLGWETMVELADQALYYVKSHGRDGWAAFRPTPTTDITTLLQELQQGADAVIEEGRLQLLGTKTDAAAVDDH